MKKGKRNQYVVERRIKKRDGTRAYRPVFRGTIDEVRVWINERFNNNYKKTIYFLEDYLLDDGKYYRVSSVEGNR